MKPWIYLLPVIFLMGCGNFTGPPQESNNKINPSESTIELADLGPAPELSNDIWINSDVPLRLADLKGQVVLLDMWTFG